MWAFAEKGGASSTSSSASWIPKHPKEGAHREVAAAQRLQECAEFEARHQSIMERLPHDVSGGGNLVLAVDFFHEGSTYYKVTERIARLRPRSARDLSASTTRPCCSGHSPSAYGILHDIDVVHGT